MIAAGYDICDEEKVGRYINLLCNQKELVKASRSIIRRKKSSLARSVAKGNYRAILHAAKERLKGGLSPEKRAHMCRVLCEAKNKIGRAKQESAKKEIVVWLLCTLIGLVDTVSGVVISLLWLIRDKLGKLFCPCGLTGECFNGKVCVGNARTPMI